VIKATLPSSLIACHLVCCAKLGSGLANMINAARP
jgi:hypothetical protein